MTELEFLGGGGEMGKRMREYAWFNHPLGLPGTWPQALRTTLRILLTTQHPMFIFWGADNYCFYNDAYQRSLGPEKHPAALGAPAKAIWEEIWPIIGPQLQQVLRGEGATWHENQLVPIIRHGELQNVYWTYSYGPIDQPDAPQGVGGVLVVCSETTEQVLAEQRLSAERERQQRLLQQMPGFVAVLDGPSHVYRYVNDAYRKIAGYRDLLGGTVREVFPELDGQGIFELLDGVYTSGAPFTASALPVHLAGDVEQRFIDLLYEPIRDGEGAVRGIFVGGYDVTERVRAEAALKQLNDTLEQKVQQRTQELMKLEEQLRQSQKMEAVGQLTGGLAHDFNNLLAGISGSLELLGMRLREGRLGEIDRYLTTAQRAARRAASLTQRLLAFSRQQTLDPKPTDAGRLIDGLDELIRRTVGPKVTLEIIAADDLWLTYVDPSQLENALLNLCLNARDAMEPDGGRLSIDTSNVVVDALPAAPDGLPSGEYILIGVSDTGAGMSAEVIQRVFDPFFTTKPLGQGTGLGLSMVYGFARQSGGEVQVRSQVTKGTTFRLYLPRYLGPSEPVEIPTGSYRRLDTAGETVLVIDDENDVRMLIVEVLQSCGYQVIEASDGPSGLKILREDGKIDLLITDVGLPGGLNGRQVADAARRVRPALRVLFITGYSETSVVGTGQLERGYHVLTKPFDIDVLMSRVADILKSKMK